MAGESMEFMDHREYQPGDDLRRLELGGLRPQRQDDRQALPSRSLSAPGRRDRRLAIDGFARQREDPRRRGLGGGAGDGGGKRRSYAPRQYLAGRGCQPIVGGDEMPTLWQGLAFDSHEGPPESFRPLPPRWRPRGIRVILSDLLWLDDPLELLTAASDRAAAVHVIQVLAADDAEPAAQRQHASGRQRKRRRRGGLPRCDGLGPLPQQPAPSPRELAPGRPASGGRLCAAGGRGALPRLGFFSAWWRREF